MRWFIVLTLVAACARPDPKGSKDEAPRAVAAETAEQRKARQSAAVLADPVNTPVIGRNCYFAGTPPAGRLEIEELVRLRRVDLMRELLAAPSPEGRVYAAFGLARVGALSVEELDKRLGATREQVTVCAGCIVSEVPAQEAFEYFGDWAALP